MRRAILTMTITAILAMTASKATGSDTVKAWSQAILARQPETTLVATYHALEARVRRAGDTPLDDASLTLLHENGQTLGREGTMNFELGLRLPLKRLRQKTVYYRLADSFARMGRVQQQWLAWQSRGIARRLLDTVEEKLLIARNDRNRLEQAQRLFAIVEEEVRAGAGSRLDLALARQRLGEAQARAADSAAALLAARRRLETWGIDLSDEQLALLLEEKPEPADVSGLDAIIDRHPEILHLRARLALAEAQAEQAEWEAKPDRELYLGLRRERADHVSDDTLLVAEITLPLGKPSEQKLARAEALLSRRESTARLAAAERDLRQSLIMAQARLAQARAQLAPARRQRAAAEEALRLSRAAWHQGDISLRDLLLAQQALLDASLNAAMAELAVNKAIRNLNQQAGE